jgi:hypothetical protein
LCGIANVKTSKLAGNVPWARKMVDEDSRKKDSSPSRLDGKPGGRRTVPSEGPDLASRPPRTSPKVVSPGSPGAPKHGRRVPGALPGTRTKTTVKDHGGRGRHDG